MSDLPLLLALVRNPVMREAIVRHAGNFEVRWSLDVSGYEKADEPGRREIAAVAMLHPALIVIELDGPNDWLPKVRSDPATRRVPVVAIPADDQTYNLAKAARADQILTPDAFLTSLPGVITDNAKIFSAKAALLSQCDFPLSADVLQGLHEFNDQQYFECHETLEHVWMQETGPVRELYRAILQVGIAYYQIQRNNYWGAHKMFLRMLQWFAPLPDRCQGIDVVQLRKDAAAAHEHLEALGPDRIAEFDRSLLKPVIFEEGATA